MGNYRRVVSLSGTLSVKIPKSATEDLLTQYRYGLALRRESERYTLKALGIKFGISANAVWARLRQHNVEPDPSAQPYPERLAERIVELEDEVLQLRRTIASMDAISRATAGHPHRAVG